MKKTLSIILGLAMSVALVAYANPADKVTICHATSSEGNPFVTIHVSENAIGGHFDNPGTPKAGHEDDLLFEGEVECPGDTPPVDVCPNIDGDQATVPEGKEIVDGQCVDEETPPEDLCDNIDGVQEVVPEGMEEEDGVCTTPDNGGGGDDDDDSDDDDDNDDNDGGSSSGSHRSSGSRVRGQVLSSSTVCTLPVPLTGFDVQSAVPNDGQNELVWNALNSHVLQAGDKFNPFTGELLVNPVPGTVVYGTNVTSVNIRWWEDVPGDIAYQSKISANDGFEAISGLPNGTHHWFQLQPVNDCGVGDWGVAVDPLP